MRIPNTVAPGQSISAKDFNTILQELRALQLRGGPGVLVQRSSGGTTVSLVEKPEAPKPTGGAEGYTPPFQCKASGTSLTVGTGFVNGLVPKYAGTSLDDSPSIPLTNNATNYAYLTVSGSFNTTTGTETVSAPSVNVFTTTQGDSATGTTWTAYGLLTSVVVSSGAVVGTVPSYFTTNLKAANFGALNSYYAT